MYEDIAKENENIILKIKSRIVYEIKNQIYYHICNNKSFQIRIYANFVRSFREEEEENEEEEEKEEQLINAVKSFNSDEYICLTNLPNVLFCNCGLVVGCIGVSRHF